MKKWMLQNKWIMMGTVVGAIGGFLYWKYVGCLTGTCAITSSPFRSTAYFGFMGALLFDLFKTNKSKNNITEDEKEAY